MRQLLIAMFSSKGVDNVYAQHIPLMKELLEQLLRGRLKDTLYPSVGFKDQLVQNQRYTTNQLQQQGQQANK